MEHGTPVFVLASVVCGSKQQSRAGWNSLILTTLTAEEERQVEAPSDRRSPQWSWRW